MPIEKKAGLFYELMIRGNHDPAKGELGTVMTYQLQTGTALVNTDSNTLEADYKADAPVDLTKDQAVAYLGEQFAGFLDQLTAERAQAKSDADAAKQAADAKLTEVQAEAAAAASVAAGTAAKAIADRDAQIAALTAAHADVTARNQAATQALTSPS
jgi:hypothetical protein